MEREIQIYKTSLKKKKKEKKTGKSKVSEALTMFRVGGVRACVCVSNTPKS